MQSIKLVHCLTPPFIEELQICYTRIPRHVITKNNLLSQDKFTMIISPTQMVKNGITMANCAKYERKTSPYLPLFPQEYPALYFPLKNIRIFSSLVFTHWVKEKVVEFI